MNVTAAALLGYIGWTLLLIIAIEIARVYLVVAKGYMANQFKPDGTDVSPFMNRLCRTHANCVEHFPIFGGFLILALATDQTIITDPLSIYLVGARLAQSVANLASTNPFAVNIRFMFFAIQLAIASIWFFSFFAAVIIALH